MKKVLLGFSLILVAAIALNSCKKEKTSKLEIRLTDAPLAVEQVNVEIVKVMIKFDDDSTGVDNWQELQTNARVYNLLALQNGVDTLLATGNFPGQIVRQVRFVLGNNNTVRDNGVTYPLKVPSGGESGLKIKVSKKLEATLETLTIDFDAGLSVKKESDGTYKLRPVLKVK